jgi:hypothetical protein
MDLDTRANRTDSLVDSLSRFLEKHSTAGTSVIPTILESGVAYLALAEASSSAPIPVKEQRLQSSGQSTRSRRRQNQYVKDKYNRERETFVAASLLSHSVDGLSAVFITFYDIFISPLYSTSFIFADALHRLGIRPVEAAIKRVLNPRGGFFQPIGVTTLCVKITNMESSFFIKLVLISFVFMILILITVTARLSLTFPRQRSGPSSSWGSLISTESSETVGGHHPDLPMTTQPIKPMQDYRMSQMGRHCPRQR